MAQPLESVLGISEEEYLRREPFSLREQEDWEIGLQMRLGRLPNALGSCQIVLSAEEEMYRVTY